MRLCRLVKPGTCLMFIELLDPASPPPRAPALPYIVLTAPLCQGPKTSLVSREAKPEAGPPRPAATTALPGIFTFRGHVRALQSLRAQPARAQWLIARTTDTKWMNSHKMATPAPCPCSTSCAGAGLPGHHIPPQ